MWVYGAATARKAAILEIGINPLRKMCLQDFLPFIFIETRITPSQSFMGGGRTPHSCVDEVTVNRVEPPSATVGTGVTSDL